MRQPVFASIRWRLVASYVLLALVLVGVMGALTLEIVDRYAYEQQLADLRANAKALALQANELVPPRRHAFELARLAQTAAFLGDVRVRFLDPSGAPLADSGHPDQAANLFWLAPPEVEGLPSGDLTEPFSLLMLPLGWEAQTRAEQARYFESLPPGTRLTYVQRITGPWGDRLSFEVAVVRDGLPVVVATPEVDETPPRSGLVVRELLGPEGDPAGYVELSAAQDFGDEALSATRHAFLLAGGGAVLLAVLLGLFMSRRLTAPLKSLQDAAGRMEAGELSARAPQGGRDEIGALAEGFNRMAARLEDSFAQLADERDALRRFIADASHELRTPITALKNFVALLQGPAADDPAAQTEFLEESRLQVDRLEWITGNLLDLSRSEAGLAALDLDDQEAGDILRSAAAPFRARAEESGIELELLPPQAGLQLRCDRARLELALGNLLDNALKFTPSGGRVTLSAAQAGTELHLWVADTGPGIDLQDQPHVFERFYRGRDAAGGGSGLGLAIVDSIARAHGGRARLESQPGEGARFILVFPLAQVKPG